MESKPGDKFRKEREFNSRVKQINKDAALAEAAILGKFRREIIDLRLQDKTGLLSGINQDELDSVDLYFYRSFQRGEKTIKDIQEQLEFIMSIPEAASKRK